MTDHNITGRTKTTAMTSQNSQPLPYHRQMHDSPKHHDKPKQN